MEWPQLQLLAIPGQGRKCTAFNVLQNSNRKHMCNSVLSPRQVELVSQKDTKAKTGDVGGAYMGQDPRLLWAKPGLAKFHQQLNKLKQKPKENEPVSSDFLERNPDVHKKGLREGWFREPALLKPFLVDILEDPQEMSTSLAEIGASTCDDLQKRVQKMQHCPSTMQDQVRKTCLRQEGWQASAKPDKDDPFDEPTCQEKMTDPNFNTPTNVATPDECLAIKVGEPKHMFFVCDTADPDGIVLEKPILCFPEKPIKCDFEEGRKVSESEFNRDKGFADYIYWFEIPKTSKA